MKPKKLLIVLLFVLLFFSGCGSNEVEELQVQLHTVTDERNSLSNQLNEVLNELEAQKAQNSELTASLSVAEEQLAMYEEAQSVSDKKAKLLERLEAFEASVNELNSIDLESFHNLRDIIEFLIIVFDPNTMSEEFDTLIAFLHSNECRALLEIEEISDSINSRVMDELSTRSQSLKKSLPERSTLESIIEAEDLLLELELEAEELFLSTISVAEMQKELEELLASLPIEKFEAVLLYRFLKDPSTFILIPGLNYSSNFLLDIASIIAKQPTTDYINSLKFEIERPCCCEAEAYRRVASWAVPIVRVILGSEQCTSKVRRTLLESNVSGILELLALDGRTSSSILDDIVDKTTSLSWENVYMCTWESIYTVTSQEAATNLSDYNSKIEHIRECVLTNSNCESSTKEKILKLSSTD